MTFSTLSNLVRVTTATTGTGTLTLGSTVTGFIAVPAGLDGLSVTYELAEPGSAPTAREVGRGVYTNSGTTLTRATVFASTNGGSKINLTSGAAYVSLTLSADDLQQFNPANITMQTGGDINCAAGSTTTNPLSFTAGTNLTSAVNGSMEYDGNALYFTPSSSSRGVVPATSFLGLTSTYTLTSQTAVQKLFNVPANGSLTVTGSTRYRFNALIGLSSMSGVTGNAFFDIKGAGTATFTSAYWGAFGMDATTQTTATAISGSFYATSGASALMSLTGTGTAYGVFLTGQFRINAGGTIIPSMGLTTAAAAVVGVDSFFECWPVSAASTTTIGNIT